MFNSFIYQDVWDGCEKGRYGVYHAFTEYQAFEACMLNGFATEHQVQSRGRAAAGEPRHVQSSADHERHKEILGQNLHATDY